MTFHTFSRRTERTWKNVDLWLFHFKDRRPSSILPTVGRYGYEWQVTHMTIKASSHLYNQISSPTILTAVIFITVTPYPNNHVTTEVLL